MKNLATVERRSPEKMLAGLLSDNEGAGKDCAAKIVSECKDTGLSLRDFLTLAIDPRKSEKSENYKDYNGFESALAFLNLPFRNDFEQGVLLQAASDTFQKYPGSRLLFPEVIDSILRWQNRQDNIEFVAPMLAQSRTINGTELISTVVNDDSAARGTQPIAEFGRIPVRKISTSQTSVGIFKHGSGIMTSYEFERRVSLDILTPFAARVARQLELSKVRAATEILINGDGVNGAAPVVNLSSFGGVAVNGTSSVLSTQYKAVAKWLISRAKASLPVDTIIGDLDMYLELLFMFQPQLNGVKSTAEAIAAVGGPSIKVNIPMLGGNANFVISSSMPANKLLGLTKAETLEELVESGSSISENERSIQTQSITYTRSENTGYKLAWGDSRSILNCAA